MEATLDKAGRIVIPKRLREQLQLNPGDTFALHSDGDDISLRPVRGRAQLSRVKGMWVLHTGTPMTAESSNQILEQIPAEREVSFGGGSEPLRAERVFLAGNRSRASKRPTGATPAKSDPATLAAEK